MLTEATGSEAGGYAEAWVGVNGIPLVANPNDIIEYNGSNWFVDFSAQSSPDNTQYVTNIVTEIQYKWIGNGWVKSYQGIYAGGYWSLII